VSRRSPLAPAVEGADYAETCLSCGASLTPEQSGFCSTDCWQADAVHDGFDLDEDGEVPELDFGE
jgi:hypothetical protein